MSLSFSQLTGGNVYKNADGSFGYTIVNETPIILNMVNIDKIFRSESTLFIYRIDEVQHNGHFHLQKFIKINRFEYILYRNIRKNVLGTTIAPYV